ncbi:MAG: hypothetical protein M1457_01860 [bacterium]|nr:hypothetical protein [bacterium]
MVYRLSSGMFSHLPCALAWLCLLAGAPGWGQGGAQAAADPATTAAAAIPPLRADAATTATLSIPAVPAVENETGGPAAQPREESVDYGIAAPAYSNYEEGLDLIRRAFMDKDYTKVLVLDADINRRFPDKALPSYYRVRAKMNLARMKENKEGKRPYRHLQDLPQRQEETTTSATAPVAVAGARPSATPPPPGTAAAAATPAAPPLPAATPRPSIPLPPAAPAGAETGLAGFVRRYQLYLGVGAVVLLIAVLAPLALRRGRKGDVPRLGGKTETGPGAKAAAEAAPAGPTDFSPFAAAPEAAPEAAGETLRETTRQEVPDIFAGSVLDDGEDTIEAPPVGVPEKPAAGTTREPAETPEETNWEYEQETIEDFVPPTDRVARPAAPAAPAASAESPPPGETEPAFVSDEPIDLMGAERPPAEAPTPTEAPADTTDLPRLEVPLTGVHSARADDEEFISDSFISLMDEAQGPAAGAPAGAAAGPAPLILPSLGDIDEEEHPAPYQPAADRDLLSVDTETVQPAAAPAILARETAVDESPTQTIHAEPERPRAGGTTEETETGDDELMSISLDQTLPSWDTEDPDQTVGSDTQDLLMVAPEDQAQDKDIQAFHSDETVAIHLPDETYGQATQEQTQPIKEGERGGELFEKTLRQGLAAFTSGDWDAAVHHLSIATALNPDSAEAKDQLREARRRRQEDKIS